MCCRWCANFFFGAFGLIIVLELVASVVASTSTAFFSETISAWGCVIFVTDISFVALLVFYVGKQLFWDKTRDFTLNWICGMCTVITAIIFGALYFLTEPYYVEGFWSALFVFRFLLAILGVVAAFYALFLILGGIDGIRSSHDPSKTNTPTDLEPKPAEERGGHGQAKTLEQSLAQIVNHVQNEPKHKQYRLHAYGSGTPFVVTMTN